MDKVFGKMYLEKWSNIKDSMWWIWRKGKVLMKKLMDGFTKDNLKMICEMDMGNCSIIMLLPIKVRGKKDRKKLEHFKLYNKTLGKKVNQKV